MNKDELISKQQLEIENLKLRLKWARKDKGDIVNRLVCIGGGLNDNILGYNHKQIADLNEILKLAENGDYEYLEDYS